MPHVVRFSLAISVLLIGFTARAEDHGLGTDGFNAATTSAANRMAI